MITAKIANSFKSWRVEARRLLAANIAPDKIIWTNAESSPSLFDSETTSAAQNSVLPLRQSRVPIEFLALAEAVACHREQDKWDLLYRLLHRLTHTNKHLLQIESDPDVREANLRAKAIHRDYHKMKAFVRFRKVDCDGAENYIAWHRPSHYIVERTAPFFVERFGSMRFSILTPDACAHWDLENLTFTGGVDRSLAPESDELEDFWRAYYAATFNPARLRVKAMKSQMPIKFWRTLPEAELIPNLINNAKQRTARMIEKSEQKKKN